MLSSPPRQPARSVTQLLAVVKHRKKRADEDCQLLRNRIKLLQHEEEKALRKVKHTKEKAMQILKMRQDNVKGHAYIRPPPSRTRKPPRRASGGTEDITDNSGSIGNNSNTHQASSGLRLKPMANREEDHAVQAAVRRDLMKAARLKTLKAIEAKKKEQARSVKKERREIRQQLMKKRGDDLKLAKERAAKIQSDLKKQRDRRLAIEEKKRAKRERELARTLENAKKAHEQSESQASMLEKLELEYITRLQRTQELQKESYQLLETALIGETDKCNDQLAGIKHKQRLMPKLDGLPPTGASSPRTARRPAPSNNEHKPRRPGTARARLQRRKPTGKRDKRCPSARGRNKKLVPRRPQSAQPSKPQH